MRLGLAGLLVLGACASAKPFTTPDGRAAYFINCRFSSTTDCYEKARATCGGNYDLLRQYRDEDVQNLEIACKA